MSRIIGFHLNGASAGEIRANCSRGWAINEGGETKVRLPAPIPTWLDFGRLVLVDHPTLPAWAGMVDTPWTARLPVEMTVYPAGYLLRIRTLDEPATLSGTVGEIATQLVDLANAQEDTRIRPGNIDYTDPVRSETFDQRPVWDQMVDMVKRAGMEMRIRPARDAENKLILYLDIKEQLGRPVNFLLHDGAGANMELAEAAVDGTIVNRAIGIGSQSSKSSRLQSEPVRDETSIARYRLRSGVAQIPNVTSQSQLDLDTETWVTQNAAVKLQRTVNALDVGATFQHLNLGNELLVHASRVYLPGGAVGWYGVMRITAMEYDEENNKVGMTIEAVI